MQVGLGLAQVAIYIATAVVFLMWLYRSHENLSSFGVKSRDLEYSSGWTVGSFFVPFVNLVVPYRAIREVWRKSGPNASSMFSELSPPGFFPLWWGLWLASNFCNQLYFRMALQENIPPEVKLTVGLLSGLLDILAAILAIRIVREIDRQQTEHSRAIEHELHGSRPPSPPVFNPVMPSDRL